MFLEKRILKICNRFTGKHPYRSRSMISIKLQSNFIEITPWHGCSPVRCSPLAWLFSFGMSVLLWTAAFDFCIYVQKKLTLSLMSRFTSKTMELQWLSIRIITRKHFYDVIRKKSYQHEHLNYVTGRYMLRTQAPMLIPKKLILFLKNWTRTIQIFFLKEQTK